MEKAFKENHIIFNGFFLIKKPPQQYQQLHPMQLCNDIAGRSIWGERDAKFGTDTL